MAELRTSIVIEAKGANAAKVVEDLRRKFGQLGQSAKEADAAGGTISRTRTALQSISTQLSQVRAAWLALQAIQGAAQSLRGIVNTADAYSNLSARLKLAAGTQASFNSVFSALSALADRNLAPLQETVQAFTRMAPAVRNLGGSYRETLALTEAVTLSLRISGALAEEQASALLQFTQGLQSNFQGDEFRALTENAPRLLQAVADGLGRSTSELKGLSTAGKLTADVVGNALLRSLGQLRSEAQGLSATVGGAFNVLQNAALQYVGATDQARGSSRALADVILLLARNFKTLADGVGLLVAGLAALGIGRLVAAFAALATTGGAVAGGFARILALIGGPVGLAASIATAAAGFALFRKTGLEAVDDVGARIKALREELQKLRKDRQAFDRGDKPEPPQEAGLAALLKKRAEIERTAFAPVATRGSEANPNLDKDRALKVIDDQIVARRAQLAEEKKLNDEKQRELRVTGQLGEATKSTEDATKGLPTRTNVLREFEQRSKDINNAFAVAFRKALEDGDTERAKEVLRQQREAQTAAAKERDDALQGLAPPVRVPQLRQEFDAAFKLTKDALEREKEALDLTQQEQLISIQNYFAERRRIADDDERNELGRLNREKLAQEQQLAELQKRRGRAKPDQREQFDEQLFAGQQRLEELNSDIQIIQARRLQEGRKLAQDQTVAERELAAQLAEVRNRLEEIAGAGGEVVRDRLQRQFDPLITQLQTAGDTEGGDKVRKLIDTEANLADLKLLEQQFNDAQARMRNAEQSITIQREAGLLSESQARQQILELHRQTAAEVESLIPRMVALANAIPGESEKNQVGATKVEFERLKTVVDDVALSVNGTVRDSFQGLFEDIARGGKSAKDIMLDLFRTIEQSITKIASQKLSDKLFGGEGKGGFGGIISKLLDGTLFSGGGGAAGSGGQFLDFFDAVHRGGIIGQPTGLRRAVNPLAFLGAPRFHSGGMLGLAPDEVPLIGKVGEEMLTRNDPRHRMNAPGQTIYITIQTPDIGGFNRSRAQVQGTIAEAAARGRRVS